ncbi:MAG: PAS domain-containing protein [Candidatus Binataceae bacterium]
MSARAGRYLRFAGGEPSHNLLKVIHPDLRLGLRAALLAAESKAETPSVAPRRMTAVIDGAPRQVALTVRPVIEGGPEAGFFLVLFDESVAAAPTSPEAERERDPAETPPASGEAEQIEEDLQRTKDLLRLTIEQYETSTEELRASNEELQAINEELRSATEELETSKEELQSLNEELTTVNQEYREKIEEVGRTNSDLQNLMASTDIGTIFLDRGLRIKRYTPHAQGLFNITLADIGRPLDHFTHRLDYGTLTADAESVLRTLQALEREVHGSDGRWYLARLAPYRTLDDKIDGVVLSFVDVTGHHEAEEQLRRQAARLNQQAEIVSQAHVLMLDPDDRIILWNEGCERMYGYTSKEAIGQVASTLLKTEFPQPLAEIKDQLERTGEWEGEMTQQVRWGARIVVASHWTLHRGEGNGDRPAILEVNNDVTARHDAERALREADRNKGWFLAMLAHELRNPLNALLSSVELLERPDVDASDTSLATGILHRQLQLLMRLVDDLLDIERLNHGKIVLSRKRVELASVIDAAIETCKPLIDASRHDFKVTLPAEPIILDADPVRLAQVFANLLHNAIKFTPAGGNIMVNAERSGEDVIVRVADNGIGVEPGMLPRLFEMYEQSTPVSGTEFGGLGVGLALVRQLTEMHGGAVAARSDGPGKGAEFVVRLPIIHPAEAEHPQ